MIILHQHEGGAARCFFAHCRGESGIGAPIHLEVVGPEHWLDVYRMAKRPESFIGEPVVVPLVFVLGQPDIAETIPGTGGRNAETAPSVDDCRIGAPRAVSHPCSGEPFDHGLESRHESAG